MAGNFSKWGFKAKETGKLRVVLFVSRNKDNKDVEGFKERRDAFVIYQQYPDSVTNELVNRFEAFAAGGVPGEQSRMYISINARDEAKVRKALRLKLIEVDDFSLSTLEPLTASIAAKKENAIEKQWMFDFDSQDCTKLFEFIEDIHKLDETLTIVRYRTPHGYAVVVNKRFDTRELMKKWSEYATLKRDDLLCVSWKIAH